MTVMAPPAGRRLEIVIKGAILTVVLAYLGFGLATASNTLGCDFLAYFNAATAWFAGQPIYDPAVTSTGTCGIYQYPPPFVLLAAPFSLFGFATGTWLWIGFLIACWLVGTAILPIPASIRWTVLLLGAISWPLVFGVRIGQVTPLLYLVFALAWRSLDRPTWLGASVAVGALIKLQPGLLGLWLLARREWRAAGVAALVGVALAGLAAIAGLADWPGFVRLVRSISSAVDIPVNMSIGATLHSLGLDPGVAGVIQAVNTAVMVALVVVAGVRLPRTPGFLVAIVATQLISPIIWTHYALLLLLPVAWLLERRHWWAAAIPLVHAWVLLPIVPNWTYSLAFHATLVALLIVGSRARAHRPTMAGVSG